MRKGKGREVKEISKSRERGGKEGKKEKNRK